MDGSKVTEKIKVIPTKQGNGPIVWQMSHGAGSGGPGNYPTVTIPAKKTGNFEITIVNPGSITFSADPIWVQQGTAKPTKSGVDPLITDIKGQNTTVLTFTDTNAGDPTTLTYQLNFTNAPPLDPIIQNGGGGGGNEMNYAVYALVGVFALALLFVVMRRAAARRQAEGQPRNL